MLGSTLQTHLEYHKYAHIMKKAKSEKRKQTKMKELCSTSEIGQFLLPLPPPFQTCAPKISTGVNGGAEVLLCAGPGARTPIGISWNFEPVTEKQEPNINNGYSTITEVLTEMKREDQNNWKVIYGQMKKCNNKLSHK